MKCPDCGAPMVLIEGRYRPFYGCVRYPKCRGTHGCHQDGRPMGLPGNAATRRARRRAHDVFDRLWRPGVDRLMNRATAYAWMAHVMGIAKEDAHIGRFNEAQCNALITHIYQLRERSEGAHADPVSA